MISINEPEVGGRGRRPRRAGPSIGLTLSASFALLDRE